MSVHPPSKFRGRLFFITQTLLKYADVLPVNFNWESYLQLNKDVAASGMDPSVHYFKYGRAQGKSYRLPASHAVIQQNYSPEKNSVLVIGHDATRTSNTIFTWNIAKMLAEKYNVVTLLFKSGPLLAEFEEFCVATCILPEQGENPDNNLRVIQELNQKFSFVFSSFTSLDSSALLKPLHDTLIPNITLIHQSLSVYKNPHQYLLQLRLRSTELIFLNRSLLEEAIRYYPELSNSTIQLITPGKCLYPPIAIKADSVVDEREQLIKIIRPETDCQEIVILALGNVSYLNGTDLFIQVAKYISDHKPDQNFHFIWVGDGYKPTVDMKYSALLAEQVRRSGLSAKNSFLPATSHMDLVLAQSDLMLVTNRLASIPIAGIMALSMGIPVVCFNNATDIVAFLTAQQWEEHCIAAYLDVNDMAEKTLALINSADQRKAIADKCLATATQYFDQRIFNENLSRIIDKALVSHQRNISDIELINNSGLFRADFATAPGKQPRSIEASIQDYLTRWKYNIAPRKPCPGFHPGIYCEMNALAHPDPYIDFLNKGQPEGPWLRQVINVTDRLKFAMPDNVKVALHLHIYYPELLNDILSRLSFNKTVPDLFISCKSDADLKLIGASIKKYRGQVVIQIFDNYGRDIKPFIAFLEHSILDHYEFVGHLHTKKSMHLHDSVGSGWYRFILNNLIGNSSGNPMIDILMSQMLSDKTIGLVFPDDPNVVGWGINQQLAKQLLSTRMTDTLPEYFNFPVGTMFWARTKALSSLCSVMDARHYPEEPLPSDGTILHAIERILPFIAEAAGYRYVLTNLAGITR